MRKRINRRMENLSNREVLYFLVGLTIVLSAFSLVMNKGFTWEWWSDWSQNFSTEMLGAIATFWLFELIVSTRQEKERLIREMGSDDNATAKNAIAALRDKGWLYDGALRYKFLDGANWEKAFLAKANLRGAFLRRGLLRDAILRNANLESADLGNANLKRAKLQSANLQNGLLYSTNLIGADLSNANLQGVDFLLPPNFRGANLKNAALRWARIGPQPLEMDEGTILPDGTRWNPDTDFARFTDPDHPTYWEPPHKWDPISREEVQWLAIQDDIKEKFLKPLP